MLEAMNTAMPRKRVLSLTCRCFAAALLLAASLAAWPSPALAQVVVVVNGAPVTALDVEHRTRLIQLTTRKTPARQEVLNELIDDKLKLFIAKRYGMEPSDSEIDTQFENMARRGRMTTQQFGQSLTSSGVPVSAFKNRMRAELVWSQLVRGKFGSSLQIGETDIAAVLQERKTEEKDAVGYFYTLRPILFIVPRGSDNSFIEAKRRDAEALRARVQSCEEAVSFARALKDVAVRAPITRSSADLTPDLREILANLPIGKLATPELVQDGIQVFALCDKKQSSTEASNKRDVRNEIFAQRFEKEGKKFLDEVRRGAMIEYR